MPFFKRQTGEEGMSTSGPDSGETLGQALNDNLDTIRLTLGGSADLITREIRFGKDGSVRAGLLYTDGLTDTPSIQNFIMESLMIDRTAASEAQTGGKEFFDLLKERVLAVGEVKETSALSPLLTALLSGDTLLLVDGYSRAFVISTRQWVERGVTEPSAQTVVRGPREGFSENIRVNTALVRRKIKDPNLWIESRTVGTRTKTAVELMYIHGIASTAVLDELRSRLDGIEIDGILESGYIEELIQDAPRSPFPTIANTERPDIVAAALLEGRVAIFVDGTPFVLLVPALFTQFFQSPEDYYQRPDIGSFLRGLRFVSSFIALLAPALFIAVTTFHHYMLPHALLISLAAQREGVPFPAFIEALIMELTFEILREAGIRMPRTIGSAISIVGAFVIGTAAVEAGIISAVIVIIVSITAIASFVLPTYDFAVSYRLLRFGFMGLAAVFGLYGIAIGLIALVLHLCSLRSFGVPYMSPIAPFSRTGMKDTFVRLPIWRMFTRPHLISRTNPVRQQDPGDEKTTPPQSPENGGGAS